MEKKHEFDKLNWRDALPPTVEVGGKDCPNRLAVYRLADSSSENDPQRASILEHIANCSHCRPIWEAAQRVEAQAIAHDPADMIDRIHDYYGTTSQPLAADVRMADEFSNFEIEPIRWLEGNQGARVGVIPSYRSAVLVIDQTHNIDQAAKATVTISFGDALDEVVLLPDQFGNDLYLWNPVFVQATITVRVSGTSWSSVLLDRNEFEPELLFLAVIRLPLDADDIWEKLAALDDRVFQLQGRSKLPKHSYDDPFSDSVSGAADSIHEPELARDRSLATAQDLAGKIPSSEKSTSEHPKVAVHVCSTWQLPAERQVAATVTSPLEVDEHEWRLAIQLADNALDGATVRLMADGAVMGIATVEKGRISWWQKWPNQRVPKNLFHRLEIVLLESSKKPAAESRGGCASLANMVRMDSFGTEGIRSSHSVSQSIMQYSMQTIHHSQYKSISAVSHEVLCSSILPRAFDAWKSYWKQFPRPFVHAMHLTG